MSLAKQILDDYNNQPFGEIEGRITLEHMINNALYDVEHKTAQRCKKIAQERRLAMHQAVSIIEKISLEFDV